jgi:hypothetical protein
LSAKCGFAWICKLTELKGAAVRGTWIRKIARVIPAQAGIQQDKHSAKRSILIVTCFAGIFDQLDSRLRGNDGLSTKYKI